MADVHQGIGNGFIHKARRRDNEHYRFVWLRAVRWNQIMTVMQLAGKPQTIDELLRNLNIWLEHHQKLLVSKWTVEKNVAEMFEKGLIVRKNVPEVSGHIKYYYSVNKAER